MNSPFNSKRGSNFAPSNLYACLLALLMIQGCATEPKERTARPPSQPPVENTAITQPLEMNNQAIPATELNQALLSPLSREQIQQRFAAINALIQAGDSNEAKKQADSLDPSLLSEQENALLNLLYAQISLSMGEAELALDNLQRIQPRLLGSEEKITYLQAKAFAFLLMGDPLASAQSRIELSVLLTTPESREQNQRAILDALSLLEDRELENRSLSSTDPLAGWIALAGIYKHKDRPDFYARLNQWQRAYPNHPADLGFLTQGLTASNKIHYPGSIAVMLPESGPFAAAGKAIKAGLMAAFDNLSSQDAKPNLHFYDTKQAPLVELYHQAVGAGAEFIIGPLEKSEIQSLADSAVLDIPVLALNHIQDLEQYNLYQFALSPMDDVEQITETARQAGHKKALLLIPENPQTQRIAGYFKENWQNGDTALLKIQTYRPKITDFSMSIGLLLNRDENSPLYAEVSPFGQEAEQKQEADMIFISAYTDEARAIKQQLNIDGAEDLAVFALPNVYSGQADPARDQILNGVTFCDMPWFFNTAYPGNLSMDSLSAVRQQFPGSYLRLIAMGIDAFNLTGRLENLDNQPYPGATGKLSLTKDNRIKRQLICARFTGGQPKIIDPTDRSGPASDSHSTAAPAQELATDHDPVN
jgi:outer membrane PBP1 activator LpoA protein